MNLVSSRYETVKNTTANIPLFFPKIHCNSKIMIDLAILSFLFYAIKHCTNDF